MKYYSQFGEDKYLTENFELPQKGYYIDIGASNGLYGSNSRLFENMGWEGLCIEPNPIDYQKCRNIRKKVMNYAVSDKEGIVDFYFHPEIPSLSGLKIHNDSYEKIKVSSVRLDTIIEKERIKKIDLLSIDTEGTELDILKSFDIRKVRPKIIIVEWITRGEVNENLLKFFEELADIYKMDNIFRANRIYILKESLVKKGRFIV